MNVFASMALAFSSFSKIPVPQFEWREENMRYMMCFFPLICVVVGLLVAAWMWLAQAIGFGPFLRGAGIALVPVLVTGGIHLDGFCDVVDAQSSHAAPERKREILKDPHAGAFASIGIASYLLAYAAFASEIGFSWQVAVLVGGMHAASRCMSGLATILFPLSGHAGMLSMFHESGSGARVPVVLLVELVVCAVVMLLANVPVAAAMICAGLACLAALFVFAKTQFGGMSGDLAGFFLQAAELAMIVVLVIVTKVVGL